mmetsp:Transcript_19875/g.43482  ORF Transcript_19875/g.43482 Transcript_19875/m.43482 type:complete len:463 (-) Transcript_19875:253-1641(-)|eukprot:CAMPEP_0118923816 /NCGR_PEP_ID=MMETSP1169-20130426/2207_1 /TAXON_ID=36882 /ORGANISM="Pyramimonas obovata, Strain CCMP722" /LENGTH=462 /DNA_ID=CAMNT_0006864867 /DNA_START=170 /DNA_END=1558 /DNA_ORIENTATION=+
MTDSVVDEIEEYIHVKQIDVIFRAILVKCFRDRPTNPVEFVMDYLISNYPDEIPASMRLAERGGDDELTVRVHHPNPEHDKYLNETLDVGSLFAHLAGQLAEAQPEDPVHFLVKAVQAVKDDEDIRPAEEIEVEESADVAIDMFEDFKQRATITGRRSSVSAECNVSEALATSSEGERRVIKKSPEERDEILDALGTNILFKALGEDLKETLVDAAFPVEQPAGSAIITQGDEGDNCYIVRQGEAMVFMRTPDGESKHLVNYGPKSAFGELALMYGNERAATVKAKTDVKLWALDRATFRAVVISSTAARRTNHQGFLSKVPILKCLTEKERAQVADVMDDVKFSPGDMIIKQGDAEGKSFYILESGTAVAEYETPTGEVKALRTYASGDYFGELAFLTETPRAVSIKATSKVTCVTLDKSSFKRLLGPCETVLRDHLQEYQAAIQKYVSTGGVCGARASEG